MLYAVISLIFGLIVGSFLNVVINRLKLKESLGGRSHCPHCKKELKAIHLVPLLSFVWLGGKCAYCKKPISPQYALVEGGTALTFAFVQMQFGFFTPDTVFLWVITAMLIVIGVYDFKHFIIPDKIVFPGIAVALLYVLYKDFSAGCMVSWDCATVSGLVGVAIIAGFFLSQYIVSQGRWIGFGDVKLGIMLGLVAGFIDSLVLLMIAYMSGAFVGIILIGLGKKSYSSKMPFGTFLVAAGIITAIWGSHIANWYITLLGF